MKKFAKKAFTLVELLVVIAIIAILAVAGVVGYMAFTKKAEVNNDTSLVAELNNYVAAASATDKINTPTDLRNILVDDGIDLATLKLSATKQGYVPGFDIVAKKFVLIKDNALADGYTAAKTSDVFAFAKTEAEANALKAAGFSLYLQSGYDKATIAIEGLGLDVGENTGITTINYTGASSANDVVIRTNSANTNLTIIAASDTVNHYGSVGSVDAQKIDMNCYNEYGKAAYVKVTEGKVVAKAGGTISVVFAANNDAEKVAVIKENQGTITTALTVIQPVSDTNGARENGIALEYSIDGATAASMTDEQKTAAIATRETEVNTVAEAAVEANLIEEIEASGLYEARIGATGYATFDEAASSILAGQTLVILKDIVRVETVSVAVWDKPFNIDLNNHTYETLSDVDVTLGNNGYKASAFCFAVDGTNSITIKNGTIKTKYGAPVYSACTTVTLENVKLYQDHEHYVQTTPEYSSGVRITSNGAVVFDGGTFEGYYALAVSNSGGNATINSGTFTGSLFFSASGTTANKTITINGGTFNNFSVVNGNKGILTIKGGTFDADPSAYVSSGHHAVNNGDGTWTVVAD